MYFITNEKEAAMLAKEIASPGQTNVITITPAAYVILAKKGFNVVSSDKIYNTYYQAKAALHIAKAFEESRQQLANAGLEKVAIECSQYILFYLVSSACQIHYLLHKHSHISWYNRKKLKTASWDKAFEAIFSKVNSRTMETIEHGKCNNPLIRFLANRHNKKIFAGTEKKLLVMDGMRPDSRNLSKALNYKTLNLEYLKSDFFTSLRLLTKPSNDLYNVFKLKGSSKIHLTSAHKLRDQIFKFSEPYINKTIAVYKSNKKFAKKFLPDVISTDSLTSSVQKLIAEHAKQNGKEVILFNHGSHTPQIGGISKIMGNIWASCGRIYSDEATCHIVKNPLTGDLIRELSPATQRIFNLMHHKQEPKVSSHPEFTFLYAGNYLELRKHVPYIVETPDEFLKGALDFAEAISELPDCRLIIRVKSSKKECNKAVLDNFLAKYKNVVVKDSGSFLDDLFAADAIVSSLSGSIEEGLLYDKPLILHNGSRCYQHLVPSEEGLIFATDYNSPLTRQLGQIIKKCRSALTKPPKRANLQENSTSLNNIISEIK